MRANFVQQARLVVALAEAVGPVEQASRDYSFLPEKEMWKQESTDNIAVAVVVGDIRVAYLLILLAVYHAAPLTDLSSVADSSYYS
jgi:hypothetical protein